MSNLTAMSIVFRDYCLIEEIEIFNFMDFYYKL